MKGICSRRGWCCCLVCGLGRNEIGVIHPSLGITFKKDVAVMQRQLADLNLATQQGQESHLD